MPEPRRRKSAADRRAEIVDTTIRLAAKLGPDRVTTQHLADEVGVTQPAIFRHFATKGEIWMAVGHHIVAQLDKLHLIHHDDETPTPDPHDRLHHIVGEHFVHISRQPAIPAILYSRELQAENRALGTLFKEMFDKRKSTLSGLIRQGQARGIHRAELVADDAAHLLSDAVQGVSMGWLLHGCKNDLATDGPRMVAPLIDGFRA